MVRQFRHSPGRPEPDSRIHTIGAKFPIEPTRRTAVTGFYLSPSDFTEVLTISIRRDGSIYLDVMSTSAPPLRFVPMEEEDWALDSTEALIIALTREGVRFLREKRCLSAAA